MTAPIVIYWDMGTYSASALPSNKTHLNVIYLEQKFSKAMESATNSASVDQCQEVSPGVIITSVLALISTLRTKYCVCRC